MANTFQLIQTITLATTPSTVTFSSIPQTYTDLLIKVSAKVTTGSSSLIAQPNFNGGGATFTTTEMYNSSNSLYGWRPGGSFGSITGDDATSTSCFNNSELYFPNYTQIEEKNHLVDWNTKRNTTSGPAVGLVAGARSVTDAVVSIAIEMSSAFVVGSVFSLYGIKNS